MSHTTDKANQTEQDPQEKKTDSEAETEETAGAAQDTTTSAEDELTEKIKEAEETVEKQKEQLLRLAAEYENYRKRTEREKTAIYADATAAAISEFLPVLDNLERALSLPDCTVEDLHKGVEMVQSQFSKALETLKVESMGEQGEAFNPEIHNAVSHIEDETVGENIIAQVYQKGYKIGEKVIRHAVVVVAN